MTSKKKIENLLEQSKISDALQELKQWQYIDQSQIIQLIESFSRNHEARFINNTISNADYNLELNRITKGILHLINNLPNNPPSTPASLKLPAIFSKGLRYWKGDEQQPLPGRDRDVEAVINMLNAGNRHILLTGPSGAGKSSFVRAGLCKKLENGTEWDPVVISMQENPHNPFLPLSQVLPDFLDPTDAGNFPETLPEGIEKLIEKIRGYNTENPRRRKTLLIIDQYEKMLASSGEDIKTGFQTFLRDFTEKADRTGLVIVLTASAYEHWLECSLYKSQLEYFKNDYKMPLLSKDQLSNIVYEPLKIAGVSTGGAFRSEIEKNVCDTDGYIALPLLSLVLDDIRKKYEEGDTGIFEREDTNISGSLSDLIGTRAEEALRYHEDSKEAVFNALAPLLVGVSSDDASFRRRLFSNEIEGKEAVIKWVKLLSEKRLLHAGEDYYELAHDILLKEWFDLKDWVSNNKPLLRAKTDLKNAVERWKKVPGDLCGFDDWVRYRQIGDRADAEDRYLEASEKSIVRQALEENDIRKVRKVFSIKFNRENTNPGLRDDNIDLYYAVIYPKEISEERPEVTPTPSATKRMAQTFNEQKEYEQLEKNIISYLGNIDFEEKITNNDAVLLNVIEYSIIAGNQFIVPLLDRHFNIDEKHLFHSAKNLIAQKNLDELKRCIDILLQKEVSLSGIYDKEGWSMGTIAAYYGYIEVIKYLSDDLKVDFTQPDEKGRLPVQVAAWWHQLEAIRFFIEKLYLDELPADENGNGLLHMIALRKISKEKNLLLEYIQSLVSNGQIDPFALNKSHETPLHVSLQNYNKRFSNLYVAFLRGRTDLPQDLIHKLYGIAEKVKDERIKNSLITLLRSDSVFHPDFASSKRPVWPFKPLVPSARPKKVPESAATAIEQAIRAAMPPEDVEHLVLWRAVRTYALSCYPDVDVFEASVVLRDNSVAYITFLKNRNTEESMIVNGTSPAIHKFNREVKLHLDTEDQMKDYLLFFTHALQGQGGDGVFGVVQQAKDIPWKEEPESGDSLLIRSITAEKSILDDGQVSWTASAMLLHGGVLFEVTFKVPASGVVEMDGDIPVKKDLPVEIMNFRGVYRGIT